MRLYVLSTIGKVICIQNMLNDSIMNKIFNYSHILIKFYN